MIKNKKDLKQFLLKDNENYIRKSSKEKMRIWMLNDHQKSIRKFLKLLRYEEFYFNTADNIFKKLISMYYENRRNTLGNKIGIYICHNCFDSGLVIDHYGNIIVNGYARIGKNCRLHGDNCIGNNGFTKEAPIIGDNVNIGIGAKIIGNVYIADNIIIGANAVVTKSFYEKGITIAGVPAEKIK